MPVERKQLRITIPGIKWRLKRCKPTELSQYFLITGEVNLHELEDLAGITASF